MEKEETQRKYLEFQSLNEQLKQLQNSLLNLENQNTKKEKKSLIIIRLSKIV